MSMHRPFVLGRLPLRRKLFLPFIAVLVLVGAVAAFGTSMYVTRFLEHSVEERLQTMQEIAYRELKKQENLLVTYANLLEYMLAFPVTSSNSAAADILQDQLYSSLRSERISVAFYSSSARQSLPYATLSALLDQAYRSGLPRFRFTTDIGSVPSLTVAAPAQLNQSFQDIIVLQTPISRNFLMNLGKGFNVEASFLSMEGELLVSSEETRSPPRLTPEEMAQVTSGQPLFKSVVGATPCRYLYRAIPLGTTDLVIAVAGAPMNLTGGIVRTLGLRFALTFFVALLLGSLLYYRLVKQVTAPAEELLQATHAVSEGNLDYRITRIADNELGQLASAFNDMLGRVKLTYEENLAREKALMLAGEELRYKDVLEEKNREIERSNDELTTRLGEISALYQISQAIISTLDINLLFERMVEVLNEVLHCQGMALLLYHPGAEELEVRKGFGFPEEILAKTRFRLDSGFSGRAAQTKELVYIHDLTADNPRCNYQGGEFPPGSLVCAPMVVKNRLAGILLLLKGEANGFTATELKLVQAVSSQAAIAIENARLYESTLTLSNLDELTRLANRRYFQEILRRELAQAQRYGSMFSLIMADVDHFKQYNDTHGHLCGDTALKMVADILLQNTRGIDLVARFGGEEFVILLPKTDKEGARAAAEKLRQCILETSFPGARKSQPGGSLTVSFGIASFPLDSKDMFELLDRADRALYRAKEEGRNRIAVWDSPEEKQLVASGSQA